MLGREFSIVVSDGAIGLASGRSGADLERIWMAIVLDRRGDPALSKIIASGYLNALSLVTRSLRKMMPWFVPSKNCLGVISEGRAGVLNLWYLTFLRHC